MDTDIQMSKTYICNAFVFLVKSFHPFQYVHQKESIQTNLFFDMFVNKLVLLATDFTNKRRNGTSNSKNIREYIKKVQEEMSILFIRSDVCTKPRISDWYAVRVRR